MPPCCLKKKSKFLHKLHRGHHDAARVFFFNFISYYSFLIFPVSWSHWILIFKNVSIFYQSSVSSLPLPLSNTQTPLLCILSPSSPPCHSPGPTGPGFPSRYGFLWQSLCCPFPHSSIPHLPSFSLNFSWLFPFPLPPPPPPTPSSGLADENPCGASQLRTLIPTPPVQAPGPGMDKNEAGCEQISNLFITFSFIRWEILG